MGEEVHGRGHRSSHEGRPGRGGEEACDDDPRAFGEVFETLAVDVGFEAWERLDANGKSFLGGRGPGDERRMPSHGCLDGAGPARDFPFS